MGLYLENVRKFVQEQGGGFLMIGGELSFSEGEYDTTPIADILPVKLLPGRGHLSEERFRPTVTEAGRSHPITDLGDVVASSQESFEALPELEGVNLVAGLMPGAEALLAHPFLNAEGGPQPVVAVREVGKGRSMAVLTDSTWAWSLPHVGAGGRGDAHRRFYANALRWLIRDPELSRVKIMVATPVVGPKDDIVLDVCLFNARYQPEGGDALKLTLTALDATDASVAPPTIEGVTNESGAWRGTFHPPQAGAWRVRVEALHEGRAIGADEDAFVVKNAEVEKLYREPRPEVLEAIAAASGGRSVSPNDVASLSFIDHEVERVHRQKTEPLWNRYEVLIVVMLLAGGEWWWRRRRGFA